MIRWIFDRELPGLADGERRRVFAKRLRERVAIEAEDLAWRQDQDRAERARREAARAQAAEQAEYECQATAAADVLRKALACEGCGRCRTAELCEVCDHLRQTEALIGEASLLAAAGVADLSESGQHRGRRRRGPYGHRGQHRRRAAAFPGDHRRGHPWRPIRRPLLTPTRSPRSRPRSWPSARTGTTP
ncbi:hypothetical protein DBP15_02025 [Streptomyces sp. CS065A]|nr:hypothetical protein DBP15_02025 [Streptomyces sp. CS065A]